MAMTAAAQRLQARLGQHPGTQGGDGGELAELGGHGADHVPRDQQTFHRQRADGIRGHGGVAQAHHQELGLAIRRRQQRAELLGETGGRPAGQALLPRQGGPQVDGDILPHRAAQRLGGIAVADADVGHGAAALETFPFGNAAAKGGKSARSGEVLRRFQGQIGTGYGHFCG